MQKTVTQQDYIKLFQEFKGGSISKLKEKPK